MNNDFKKGIEQIKKVSLSPVEKSTMLSNIFGTSHTQSQFRTFIAKVWHSYGSYAVGLALFFVVVGGAASLEAQSSLPGDLLYSLKVNVNEPLESVLIIDRPTEVEVQIEKVERRLKEIEALAEKGDIPEKKAKAVEKSLDKNLEDLGTAIEKSDRKSKNRNKDKEANSTEALEKIRNKKISDDESENIKSLESRVREKIDKKIKEIDLSKKKRESNRDSDNKRD